MLRMLCSKSTVLIEVETHNGYKPQNVRSIFTLFTRCWFTFYALYPSPLYMAVDFYSKNEKIALWATL